MIAVFQVFTFIIVILIIFIDSISVDDVSKLSMYQEIFDQHENLLFLSYGNDMYHAKVIQALQDYIFIQPPAYHCVNINDNVKTETEFRDFVKLNKHKNRLFVVHNMEKLVELYRNNYIFSVKDPTMSSRAIVLLTWDKYSHPLVEDSTTNLQSFTHQILKALEEKLNSEELFVNGAAAVARIDDVFHDDSYIANFTEFELCASNTISQPKAKTRALDLFKQYINNPFYQKIAAVTTVISTFVYLFHNFTSIFSGKPSTVQTGIEGSDRISATSVKYTSEFDKPRGVTCTDGVCIINDKSNFAEKTYVNSDSSSTTITRRKSKLNQKITKTEQTSEPKSKHEMSTRSRENKKAK